MQHHGPGRSQQDKRPSQPASQLEVQSVHGAEQRETLTPSAHQGNTSRKIIENEMNSTFLAPPVTINPAEEKELAETELKEATTNGRNTPSMMHWKPPTAETSETAKKFTIPKLKLNDVTSPPLATGRSTFRAEPSIGSALSPAKQITDYCTEYDRRATQRVVHHITAECKLKRHTNFWQMTVGGHFNQPPVKLYSSVHRYLSPSLKLAKIDNPHQVSKNKSALQALLTQKKPVSILGRQSGVSSGKVTQKRAKTVIRSPKAGDTDVQVKGQSWLPSTRYPAGPARDRPVAVSAAADSSVYLLNELLRNQEPANESRMTMERPDDRAPASKGRFTVFRQSSSNAYYQPHNQTLPQISL